MSEYLLINLFIVIVPLILIFEQKLKFYKKLPAVLVSISVVSTAYIIWDSLAAKAGDWAFNQKFLIGNYFFDLPIEEILFFITVPYSIIFIYETAKFYLKEQEIFFSRYIYFAVMFLLSGGIILFAHQNYTMIVLVFCFMFFVLAVFIFPPILKSKIFWITILISYIPFLIVNYILTSLPIVTYNSSAIWGNRFLTIPFEDFFYSFSMTSLWLLVYLIADRKLKWQRKE
ncbi:MAG: lycopene cyclase domain-containing protein [Ignavibacteriaceae bacterium]|nr:lycopene cyclase domain-containing protein [Ignavibacteriaceae bacterium]